MSTYDEVVRVLKQRIEDAVPLGEGAAFGREIGWKKSQVSKLKSDPEPNPRLRTLCAMADALGTTPSELLSPRGELGVREYPPTQYGRGEKQVVMELRGNILALDQVEGMHSGILVIATNDDEEGNVYVLLEDGRSLLLTNGRRILGAVRAFLYGRESKRS